MSEAADDAGYDDGSERDCFHCAGEGWVECPHPLECTDRHSPDGRFCPCASCGGTGLAKDMTIW